MMVVKPKVRGFICTTAHPTGCREHVKQQIQFVKKNPMIRGPKNVLVIGASTGYGLASWITAVFGAKANAIGVFYERPPAENRTATAGWYNAAAVEFFAREEGIMVTSINGDAFSSEIKDEACAAISQHLGKVDLIIYSVASPRRVLPDTGEVVQSTLKTIDKPFRNKSIDPLKGELTEVEVPVASIEEIEATVQVMGGEDWSLWIKALNDRDLIAEGALTIAYSYVGPELTYPIYRKGTIGKAKEHLEQTAQALNQVLRDKNATAYVSVNKALVTQASAAIPVVPLYISLLFNVMKGEHIHEGCIEQIVRLFRDHLFTGEPIKTDSIGRIRLDDLEMRDDVQEKIATLWEAVNSDNLKECADLAGYHHDFYELFGFGFSHIDYDVPVDIHVAIPSLSKAS